MPRKRKLKPLRPIRVGWVKSNLCWGVAYPDEHRIEIDPRCDDKTLLNIAVHEVAHVILDVLDETAVEALGNHAADVLWRLGFRRIEKGDE